QAAGRSRGGNPGRQATLERGQRARHPAQPGLCGPGADQPDPGRPGPAAPLRAAAGWPGRKPRSAPAGGVDRGAGAADRERGDLGPGAGQAGYQPAGRGAQYRHEYLLRALVSCGACRLGCTGRQTAAGYRYYLCRGHTDALRAPSGQRCRARYIPARQLDELVWAGLCALLTDPSQVAAALARARGGAWLPQELQARQETLRKALSQAQRQQQRLLDAYLAEVITLPELERKREELDRRCATLLAQQRQLDAIAQQRLELAGVADGIERFCQTVRAGLATAT